MIVDNYHCTVCNHTVEDDTSVLNSLGCDKCKQWYHRECAQLTVSQFQHVMMNEDSDWLCETCAINENRAQTTQQIVQSVELNTAYPDFRKANSNQQNLNWGVMKGYESVDTMLTTAYNCIVKWKKNFFKIPLGNCGRAMVDEAARLTSLYNDRTSWEGLALKALIVFIPLMTQKPSKNSKTRDHKNILIDG